LYWSSGVAALAEPAQANALLTIVTDETVTVTTLNDISDFSGPRQVSDLPGPDGRVSFREAVTAANNTPGGQTIAFAIPISEFWLVSDVALLKLEDGAFFLTDSGTTIDFSTQTTNIGDTNPTGPEVGVYGLEPNGWGIAAIFMNGDNGVIKGLGKVYQRGYGVKIVGDNNRVIGCQISGAINAAVSIEGYMGGSIPIANTVGGTAPGEGNILTGLRIGGPAENNIVIGNTIIGGVDVIGSTQYGVIARDNRIGGPTVSERNVISGAGYYGEEGYPVGEQVSVVDADGTIVEGNYIGTTVDGMARYPQQIGPIGVEVRDSRNTTIRGNLIAGLRTVGTNHYNGQIFGWAVLVGATNRDSNGTVVEGNTIGLAADGVTPIVTRSGVTVSPLSGNYHAFGTRISANHIARVETTGVVIGSQENGITITGNSIHDSGALGIDLFTGNFAGVGGVTQNDAGDLDVGGNGLQNYPVLQSAATTGSTVTVQGTLDSSPTSLFTLEFFTSPVCDSSGFGEGARFLGSTTVTTNGAGHATFSATLPAAVPVGANATATATRMSTGDTSEFSACASLTSAPGLAPTSFDFDGDHKTDISIFRPSDGTWWWSRSSDLAVPAAQFGNGTDKVVAADYTGDGKTDVAFWRPSTGHWFVLRSENWSYFSLPFGTTGDTPMPADYDGDGKADAAVFRQSTSTWYILRSSDGQVSYIRFGASGDQPVAADYDGDGKADVGIFRPSDLESRSAEWWILRSNGLGVLAMQFGSQGDKAVAGDYTGDGKTDVAVWRPSNGNWYILRSEDLSFYSFPFGTSGDLPVPGDYDGDGKTDAAVFRPPVSTWFVQRSTAGVLITGFGLPTDQPVPSAFVR